MNTDEDRVSEITGYDRRDVEAVIADLVDLINCGGCRENGPKLCADYPYLEGICLRKPR